MSVVLATAGYDHKLRFWEAPSGRCSRILKFSDSQLNRLEISPDKQFIAAAGNPAIRVYEVVGDSSGAATTHHSNQDPSYHPHHGHGAPPPPQQAAVLTLEGHMGNVTCIGFQKEGRFLYSSSEDGTIKVWDLRNPHYCANFCVGAAVNSVALRTDRDEFVSGDQSGSIKIWDLRKGSNHRNNHNHRRSRRSLSSSSYPQDRACLNSVRPAAGTLPLSPSNLPETEQHQSEQQPPQRGRSNSNQQQYHQPPYYHPYRPPKQAQQPQFYSEGTAPIQAVDISEDSRTLVAISNHGTVFVWDPSSSSSSTATTTNHEGRQNKRRPNRSLPPDEGEEDRMHPSGVNQPHLEDEDNDQDYYNRSNNNDENDPYSTQRHDHHDHNVDDDDDDDDENQETSEDHDSPSSGLLRPITKFRAHAPGTYCLQGKIAPDCRHLVTTSSDGTAKLWDTTTWELTATLVHHPIVSAATQQQQQQQQRGAARSTQRNIHGGRGGQEDKSPPSWVWDAAFCADSTYLVTASSDQVARLWNLRSGDVVRQYHGHESAVTCVALNDSNVM
ncbi:hypothetical protein ACA910_012254 [Epithemia clementina (nom. ined.)]